MTPQITTRESILTRCTVTIARTVIIQLKAQKVQPIGGTMANIHMIRRRRIRIKMMGTHLLTYTGI